jgi:hypothetical protein
LWLGAKVREPHRIPQSLADSPKPGERSFHCQLRPEEETEDYGYENKTQQERESLVGKIVIGVRDHQHAKAGGAQDTHSGWSEASWNLVLNPRRETVKSVQNLKKRLHNASRARQAPASSSLLRLRLPGPSHQKSVPEIPSPAGER